MFFNFLVLAILLTPLWYGIYRNHLTQNDDRNLQFVSGKLPENISPDSIGINGVLKGSVNDFQTNWIGKKFDSKTQTGINRFQDKDNVSERFPFKTYFGKDASTGKVDVLKIDYNIPENPFWLRFILDEIVEVEDGKYLGKVYINLIPGFPLAIGYFNLEK